MALWEVLNIFVAIAEVKSIGHSITRIPGDYYFVTQLSILVPMILATAVMLIVSISNKGQLKHRKNLVLFNRV